MTSKFPLVFAVSLGISFPLLLSVFGVGGWLHNQALEDELEQLRYEQSVLSLTVQSLEEQRTLMGEPDALRDAAFKYGYQSEGEAVYFFEDNQESAPQASDSVLPASSRELSFTGLPTFMVFLIALAFSTILTVCYAFVASRHEKHNEKNT